MKKKLLLILLMFVVVIGLTGCNKAKNAQELNQKEFYNAVQSNDYKKYEGNYYKISGDVNLIGEGFVQIHGMYNLQFKISFKNKDDAKNFELGNKAEVTGKIKEIFKVENKPTTIVVEDARLK